MNRCVLSLLLLPCMFILSEFMASVLKDLQATQPTEDTGVWKVVFNITFLYLQREYCCINESDAHTSR